MRLRDHHELVPRAQLARRLGEPTENRQPETLPHLFGRAHARVECFTEEREPDAEHDSESEAEDAVAHGARLDLHGLIRNLHRHGFARQQRDDLVELVALRQQVSVNGRVLLAGVGKLCELLVRALARAGIRLGVELGAELRERVGVRLGQPLRAGRVVIPGGQLEQVGVRLDRCARVLQEVVHGAVGSARELERALRNRRNAGQVGLRLRAAVGLLVAGRVVEPVQLVRDVLLNQQHLAGRLVDLLLAKR